MKVVRKLRFSEDVSIVYTKLSTQSVDDYAEGVSDVIRGLFATCVT